jgi:hypothetical protein
MKFVMDELELEKVFSELLWFCPTTYPSAAPYSAIKNPPRCTITLVPSLFKLGVHFSYDIWLIAE